MILDYIFNAANLFVLPFWTLMIFLPNWGVTRKVMSSTIPLVLLAATYIYLFIVGFDSEAASSLANPNLSEIAGFFAQESAAAIGWVHFIVMDLFVGRWIYWEGQRTGLVTTHSLILCLFAGPSGLLSHIITAGVWNRFFASAAKESTTETTPTG
jgi:hypothetical protein